MNVLLNLLSLYIWITVIVLSVIWLASVVVTVVDKWLARKNKRRVSEKTLFLLAMIGGAMPMYLTMRAIRHKTLHKKFMIGLPLIMILHVILLVVIVLLLTNA